MSVDLSPDARWVVFDLLGHIYRVPVDGGEAESLTQGSGVALNYHPRFSSDGLQVAFVSDRSGQDDLWVMNADGTDPRPVAQDYNSHVLEPVWSPDGESVIVRRQQVQWPDAPERTTIWRYPVEGGPGEELVGPNEVISWPWVPRGPSWPSISGDGGSLFYQIFTGTGARKSSSIDVFQGSWQIRRVDLRTGTDTGVTSGLGGGFAPEISPDGRWLAFAQRIPDGVLVYEGHRLTSRTALWLRDLETGAERVVMDPIGIDAAEEGLKTFRVLPGYGWSRDGSTIVIAQGGKIRLLDVASGEVRTVPFTARVQRTISERVAGSLRIRDDSLDVKFLQYATASPDGATLAFQGAGKVWVQPLPGGTPRRLTPPSFTELEYGPAWSPDGARVAFTTVDEAGEGHVWTARAQGPGAGGPGAPIRLTTTPGEYLHPVWSPDGETVVTVRGAGASARGEPMAVNLWYALVRLPAGGGGGDVTEIVRVRPNGLYVVRPSFGPDGRVFYTEPGRADQGSVTDLKSVPLEGGDARTHARFRFAQHAAPSPDGAWVAVEENDDVYVAPLGSAADQIPYFGWRDSRLRRLTRSGGMYPRWRGSSTLEYGSGPRYSSYDVERGNADTTVVRLIVPRATPVGRLALTDVRIVTANADDRVIDGGSIVIEGPRISCVGTCDVSTADRVISLRGKTVIPGFVDMHLHFQSAAQGVIGPNSWDPAIYLAYGATTGRDPGDWPPYTMAMADMVAAGRVVGPRTFGVGGLANPVAFGSSIGEAVEGRGPFREIATPEDAQAQIERVRSWGSVALKNYYQPARDRRQWLIQAAREAGLTATAENDDATYTLGFVMDGNTGFEHSLRNLPLYGDVTKFLGGAGIVYSSSIIAGTGSQRGEDYWIQEADYWLTAKERLWRPWLIGIPSQRRRPLRPVTDYRHALYAQGVADVIEEGGYGSIGSHGENDGLGVHYEVWMNASAMSPVQALKVASLHGAYFLGAEKDIGSLEVGKLADLIVLNSNPLVDIQNTLDMMYVMKGGRLYDDDTLDEVWPTARAYGLRPWVIPDALKTDERSVGYHDGRR